MKKEEVRARIEEIGIIPGVRMSSAADACFAAETVNRGGIPIAEITMTVPEAIEVITSLTRSIPEMIVGAPSQSAGCGRCGAERVSAGTGEPAKVPRRPHSFDLLSRIVVNDALILLRQRRRREPLHENSVNGEQDDRGVETADGRPTPEEIFCESERRATVRRAGTGLRESLRVAVLYGELQGLTSAETAPCLGLTVSAVKARTHHARRFLRKHLERNFMNASALSRPQKRQA